MGVDAITDVEELTETGKWRKQFELLERIAAKADQAAADAKAARSAAEQAVTEPRKLLTEWRQEQMSFWRGVRHAISGAVGVFWKEFNKLDKKIDG